MLLVLIVLTIIAGLCLGLMDLPWWSFLVIAEIVAAFWMWWERKKLPARPIGTIMLIHFLGVVLALLLLGMGVAFAQVVLAMMM